MDFLFILIFIIYLASALKSFTKVSVWLTKSRMR